MDKRLHASFTEHYSICMITKWVLKFVLCVFASTGSWSLFPTHANMLEVLLSCDGSVCRQDEQNCWWLDVGEHWSALCWTITVNAGLQKWDRSMFFWLYQPLNKQRSKHSTMWCLWTVFVVSLNISLYFSISTVSLCTSFLLRRGPMVC